MSTTRLVLVRHGEPSDEVRGRCYGRLDVTLSPRGLAQAEAAAQLLSSSTVTAIYASPLRRALDTARAFSTAHRLPVTVDERLREIDFGDFEGLSWDEAKQRHPDVYHRWMTRPTSVEFPNGESWTALKTRALAARREIAARHAGETVVVVAHGGVTRALVADALGLPDEHAFRVEQSYGGVSVVDEIDGAQLVRLVNGGWPAR